MTSLPQLEVLFELLNAPSSEVVCDQSPTAARKLKKLGSGEFD